MPKGLSLLLFLGYCTLSQGIFLKLATAQITPDGTTNTTVDVDGNDFTINQGDRAGSNLFHCFRDFSVPNGGSAFFNNAADIVNIFSRVTGGNISNIDGLIRANDANLFLINPAGIIFGAGARLDFGGSFYGSTADSILFEDGEFSATDLDNRPLLTINAPIGLNFRDNPGDIVNNSVPDDNGSLSGSPGATFALLGGDVNFTGGVIDSGGSNVFIGGLSESGTISLDDNFHPSFPDDVARADVSIINGAMVDVSAGGGGSITVNARNLEVRDGSQLLAGIREGLGTSEAQAGDITINATDTVLFNNSEALSEVDRGAVGNAGDVSITTGSLEVTNGSKVSARTFGQGNAGSVEITANDFIKFDGEGKGKDGFENGARSEVGSDAVGNAGDVSITTGSLEVTNGAQVSASTNGVGNAGSVTIKATDLVKFDGEDQEGKPSGAFSNVNRGAEGNAGGVSITTGSLEVLNSAKVSATTWEKGNAGSVTIKATDLVKFDGEDRDGNISAAFTQVNSTAVGKAGGVSITTGSLEVTNGAQVSASTNGVGNAGSVTIKATDLVKFDGVSSQGVPSGAFSRVNSGAEGNAGGVSITTKSLEVLNGALLDVSTRGKGDAGSVTIKATDLVKFDGEDKDGFPSEAFSGVNSGAEGNAGGVSITTGSLEVTNGARVSASTRGVGDAGSVTISTNTFEASNGGQLISNTSSQFPAGNVILKVKDKITVSGSETGIFANTTKGSTGQGGSINIDPQSVTIQDGATIAVNSDGSGQGGSITLAAEELTLDNGTISAETRSNNGGDLTLILQDLLLLRNGSQISTTAGNEEFGGDGGNITIDTPFIVAFPNQNNDITANAFEGNGGNINITTEGIFGIEERSSNPPNNTNDIDASSEFGLDGTISISNPDANIRPKDTEIPSNPIESEPTFAQACQSARTTDQPSGLTIKGKGGIPPKPSEPFTADALIPDGKTITIDKETDLNSLLEGEIETEQEDTNYIPADIKPIKTDSGDIYPARGIIKTEDGQIILTRYPTDNIDTRTPHKSANCAPS